MPNQIQITNVQYQIIFIAFAIFLLFPSQSLAKNISMSFTSQAPEANWRQPWQDACEETSITMVDNFYQNNIDKKIAKNKAKKDILQILKIKESQWSKSLDENAEKVAAIINNYLPWEAKLVENPTIEDFKSEIDKNQPIIIPAYGKALKNPHFSYGGPDYHMLVISGYDDEKQEFITQDPGTRYGLDFRYSYDKLMNAIHDFIGKGKTKNGPKVAIFTSKQLTDSAEIDADHDGLTKEQEFRYSSIPWLKDSDGDGYSDGAEVANGYSPVKKFEKL